MADFSIHLCVNCGNKCSGKYCNYCKTVEQRQKGQDLQDKINAENVKKGFKPYIKAITYEPIVEPTE